MSGKMFAAGSHARLLDGSEVEVLDAFEDEQQYCVRILTGPAISLVRRGRVLRVRIITVPAENVEPLVTPSHLTWMDAFFAGTAGRRC
jgi:hypothetical protein